MSLAVLGDGGADSITFEVTDRKVLTWMQMRREGAARWAQHETFGSKPKREFLGAGLDKIDMTARFDISQGIVPRDQMRLLRKLRDTGAVSQFTVGGSLVGDFTVNNVGEDPRQFSPKGVMMICIATFTLEEYE